MALSDNWVKYKIFDQNGFVEKDYMLKTDVPAKIEQFKKTAEKLFTKTNADYVLYAIKHFNERCELEEVKFYEWPMSAEEFNNYAAPQVRVLVYALHNTTNQK